jgi:hypothetical protein
MTAVFCHNAADRKAETFAFFDRYLKTPEAKVKEKETPAPK